jgi:hypothetical protein
MENKELTPKDYRKLEVCTLINDIGQYKKDYIKGLNKLIENLRETTEEFLKSDIVGKCIKYAMYYIKVKNAICINDDTITLSGDFVDIQSGEIHYYTEFDIDITSISEIEFITEQEFNDEYSTAKNKVIGIFIDD